MGSDTEELSLTDMDLVLMKDRSPCLWWARWDSQGEKPGGSRVKVPHTVSLPLGGGSGGSGGGGCCGEVRRVKAAMLAGQGQRPLEPGSAAATNLY